LAIKILEIKPDSSLADDIKPGDLLIRINGHKINDILDVWFHSSEENLVLELSRNGDLFSLELEKDFDEDLGLIFPEMNPRLCGNDCIFCFVDQCPPGVRETLKVKDEDYRFSFLHGNYITLSNLGEQSLRRIIEYNLSPLYISVHAMDKGVRNYLLGRKKDDHFLEKFRELVDAGIKMHTQVVIIPEINDNGVLKDTIEKLSGYYPQVASIGLIPVGLTANRANLPKIEPVSGEKAREIIGTVDRYRFKFEKKFNDPLVYAADEMYLRAELDIPETEYYGDFPQIENGIGMVRRLIDIMKDEKADFPIKLTSSRKVIFPTGRAMKPVLDKYIVPEFNAVPGLEIEVVEVVNRFFGEPVTVSGLLGGEDILRSVKGIEADMIILPPDCLNIDNLFIDNMILDEFIKSVNSKVKVFNWSFLEIFGEL